MNLKKFLGVPARNATHNVAGGSKKNKGFTLIEILIVIGIIAILAAIVIIAINPAKQFAQARNTQRTANINAILNAIGQRIADNKGIYPGTFAITGGVGSPYTCNAFAAAGTTETILSTSGSGTDEFGCLVPTYIPTLPIDPKTGTATSTGYTIKVDSASRITICAPESQSPVVAGVGEASIPNAPAICVTR